MVGNRMRPAHRNQGRVEGRGAIQIVGEPGRGTGPGSAGCRRSRQGDRCCIGAIARRQSRKAHRRGRDDVDVCGIRKQAWAYARVGNAEIAQRGEGGIEGGGAIQVVH